MKEKMTLNNAKRDFAWYFAGSALPALVGLIRTPVFTRHFSAEEFGSLGIVQITYTYLGVLFFSWISSCLWRYYQQYKAKGKLDSLNGSLLMFTGISVLVVAGFSLIWMNLEDGRSVRSLIVWSFAHLVLSQLVMGYLVIVRLEGQASRYMAIQSIKSVLSFALSLVLVFSFQVPIEALVMALAIVEGTTLLLLLIWNPLKAGLSFRNIDRAELRSFIQYGSAGLIVNLCLLSLNLSDRYVILYFGGLDEVGIYDQVYKISLLSVSSLVTVFFNTVNPELFKTLETEFKNSVELIGGYQRIFILIGVPLVVFLSLFSKEIANVVLGEEFRVAHSIMPYVFAGAWLQGYSNFYELRLKFSDRMRRLSLIFLVGAILNLVLNLWWVPVFGYRAASWTTLLTFAVMLILFHMSDRELKSGLHQYRSDIVPLIIAVAIQVLLFTIVDNYVPSVWVKLALGLIFVFVYGRMINNSLLKQGGDE